MLRRELDLRMGCSEVYKANKDRDEIILKYIPLVKQVVSRIDGKNSGYEFDDLVNVGIIGLMDALEKYDSSKKVPFEAYARIRINGTIIDELRKAGPVSRTKMDKLNNYYRAKNKLESELMRGVSDQEVIELMGISLNELNEIYETIHYLSGVSLESVVFNDTGSGIELKDMIEDIDAVAPEDKFLDGELKDILKDNIEKLNEREQILLNLYYVEELNMKEIAYVLDISIPRVSQIHGEVLNKLRSLMVEV